MQVKNLKGYLATVGMTLKDFCEMLDCDDKHMSKVMNGHVTAGHRLAKDVKHATGGVIELQVRLRKRDLRMQEKQKRYPHSYSVDW